MFLSLPAEVASTYPTWFIQTYVCTIVKRKYTFNKIPPDGVPDGRMERFGD
jgi:hypothetical protein